MSQGVADASLLVPGPPWCRKLDSGQSLCDALAVSVRGKKVSAVVVGRDKREIVFSGGQPVSNDDQTGQNDQERLGPRALRPVGK